MIKAKRIGHATFETPDLDRQIDYFSQVVGLSLAGRETNRAFLATNSGQLAIVLEKGAQAACTRLAFEVSPGLSSAEMAQRLSTLGLKSEARSDALPGVSTMLAFADMKGTTIELFSEWSFVNKGPPAGGAVAIKLGHIRIRRSRPEGDCRFLRARSGLPDVGLDRGLFRLPPLQRRPSHREFHPRAGCTDAPHRLRDA